ncbi:hypothetical protein [Halotalea alkalilenta]|uniref:Uncharacterized protein n=1 Tax=Halotalea alkalilenta TaxID=376489 RepID=A0A172YHQ2_9GAMM|nr:hypothetical protein [Halotalea alkalilenta]ANF58784.1 hypothetical protein A5892_16025 [Halotalea alkalilenta]
MNAGPRHRRRWVARLCSHPLFEEGGEAEGAARRARAEALVVGGERGWLQRLFAPRAPRLEWTGHALEQLRELDRRDADALFILTGGAPARRSLDAALARLGRPLPCYALAPQEPGTAGDFIIAPGDALDARLLQAHLLMLLEQRIPIALRLGQADEAATTSLPTLLLAFLQRQRLAAIGEADNRALTLLPVRATEGQLELAEPLDLDAFITLHSDLGGTTAEWIERLATLIESELRARTAPAQA